MGESLGGVFASVQALVTESLRAILTRVDDLCTRPWDVITYYLPAWGGRPMCQLYLSLPSFSQWNRYSALDYLLKFGSFAAIYTLVLIVFLGVRRWRGLTLSLFWANALVHPLCFYALTSLTAGAGQSIGPTLFFFFFFCFVGQLWVLRDALKKESRRMPRILLALLVANVLSWCVGGYPDF